ncbi:helix-turn-helix domain-containing protein [Caproiciproducens sp.]
MYEIFEQLLKRRGITPYRVHKETGVPQSTLSDWKNGRGVPKIDKLQKIADYFGVTVDYLINGNDQKEKPLVNNDEELTEYLEELKTRPEMKMLFNLAKGATKEDVEKAVKIVEAFLKKD